MPGATFESLAVASKTKKPARRLAFSCPKAGEELLLRRSGSRSSSSRSSSASSRGSSSASSRSSSSASSRSSSSSSRSGSSVGRLRSFSSRLRSFYFGRLSGLRGFGLATSGHSEGEEGSYEERLLHLSEILNVMELHGQLVDRNVSIAINREFYHAVDYLWCSPEICGA